MLDILAENLFIDILQEKDDDINYELEDDSNEDMEDEVSDDENNSDEPSDDADSKENTLDDKEEDYSLDIDDEENSEDDTSNDDKDTNEIPTEDSPEEETSDNQEDDKMKQLNLFENFEALYYKCDEFLEKTKVLNIENSEMCDMLDRVQENMGILKKGINQYLIYKFLKSEYIVNMKNYYTLLYLFNKNVDMLKNIKLTKENK